MMTAAPGVPRLLGVLNLTPGDVFVVTEMWRGRLWSAVPHKLVEDSGSELVSFVAAGTMGTFATSRGIAGRDHLPRAERKLAALRTCQYNVAEVALDLDTLHFFARGMAARVNLGWRDGRFIGWYVNFELPPEPDGQVVTTMDLILDALVTPEGDWHWKDEADFGQALNEGLLDPTVRYQVEEAETGVRTALRNRTGPFAEQWIGWRPFDGPEVPALPDHFGEHGPAWM
jgi:predicted RNA-binding protein associated with RNAse of E/G family